MLRTQSRPLAMLVLLLSLCTACAETGDVRRLGPAGGVDAGGTTAGGMGGVGGTAGGGAQGGTAGVAGSAGSSGSSGDAGSAGTGGTTGAGGSGATGGTADSGGSAGVGGAGGAAGTGGAGGTGGIGCNGDVRTVECFYQAIVKSGARTVKEAIPLLPTDVRSALMLMETTLSRHQASPSYPRVVMYGKDAGFIVSVSTKPDDPLYEVLEMAELEPNGHFKFRQLDMNPSPPELAKDDAACASCHNERARFIWGIYRTWPGLVGDGDNMVSMPGYVEDLKQRAPERFGDLIAADPFGEELLEWSGEVFNYMVARVMGVHLAKVMKSSPAYTKAARYALVAAMCDDKYKAYQYLKTFGLTPADTRADFRQFEAPADTDFGYYFGGGDYEDQLVEVAVADLVFGDKDAELALILKPFTDLYAGYYPLTQQNYDLYGGLFNHDLPEQHNGASVLLGEKNGERVWAGYGGNYAGFRLWGYGGAWAGSNSYLNRWLADDPAAHAALTQGGSVEQAFCAHIRTKAGVRAD